MLEKLSVIVPCYNEEQSVGLFYTEAEKNIKEISDITVEYLFIDDGSSDDTLKKIKELHAADKRVKYISFSKNFGKEAAMFAGLEYARGDYAVIMDADLQDPPRLLPEMLRWVREGGYDSVATRRVSRKGEPAIRSFFARRFYGVMNRISDVELKDGTRDYRLMTRKYADAVLRLREYNRFSKGIFGWVGFRTKWLEFENQNRIAGETKWSFWKLVRYSIQGIISFSEMPLYLSSVLGGCMCGVALVAILFIIVRQLLFGGSAFGWPSMACIVILIGGIQLLAIGILGLYFSKMYLEIKRRPIYIEREVCVEEAGETVEDAKSADLNVDL